MASNSNSIDMVLTIFTAFNLIIVGIAAAVRDLPNSAHISVPNLVWGYAICDRCKEMAVTAKSTSISGLNIVVECLDDKGALEFSASNSTDEKGSFMLHLPESIARSHISVARCSAKVFHIPSECNISTIYTPPSLALQYAQTGQQFYGIGPFVYQPDQPHSSCFTQQNNQNPESNDANQAYQSYGYPYAAAAGSYHQNLYAYPANYYANPLGLNAYSQYGASAGDMMQGYGYGAENYHYNYDYGSVAQNQNSLNEELVNQYGAAFGNQHGAEFEDQKNEKKSKDGSDGPVINIKVKVKGGCCGAKAWSAGTPPVSIPSISIPRIPNINIPGINIPPLPTINLPRIPRINIPGVNIPGLPTINFPNIPGINIPGLPNFQIPTITIPIPGSPPIQIPGFPFSVPGQAPESPPIQSPGFPSVTFPGVPPSSSRASSPPSPSTQQSPAPPSSPPPSSS